MSIQLRTQSGKKVFANIVFKGDRLFNGNNSYNDMPVIELVEIGIGSVGNEKKTLLASMTFETVYRNKGYLTAGGEHFTKEMVEKLKEKSEKIVRKKLKVA